jgi:hypothetical protein
MIYHKKNKIKRNKFVSSFLIIWLITSTILIGISPNIPTTSAAAVSHNIGDLDVNMLTDFGRIFLPLQWGTLQTSQDSSSGMGFIGLVVDQDNYDHNPGSVDVADCFASATSHYMSADDFSTVTPISLIIDDSTTQKSFASYQNTGTTQDANDILVNQTAWSINNKDWVIIEWNLINLKGIDITGVSVGLELPISQEGGGYGLGGDSGDDIDGFDAANDVYWAQDDDGTTLGFGSAMESEPITHYYSKDYQPATYSEYKGYWENETWLYDRLHAPNAAEGSIPGNRTSTVGWNGVTISAGTSMTFTLVIAINDSLSDTVTAVKDAQYYYRTVATGFRLTEFSDADSALQRIEVFNFGGRATDLTAEGYFLSLDGGFSQLAGNWDKIPLGTNEHGVFTLSAGNIGPEGDTIGLYQDLGGGNIIAVDGIPYGQEGRAPDPLIGESSARQYDTSSRSYTNFWLRNASTGSTWGAENNVASVDQSPLIVINEVMFNPGNPELGYIELMYIGSSSLDLLDYKIVCDSEYVFQSSIVLNSSNRFFILIQPDDPAFFSLIDPPGDNIYLYDGSGELLDMFGWSSPHLIGMSAMRIPDGNGTYSGYNDITSETAGWVFDIPLEVLMTELSDSASSISQIEVYNPSYYSIDFSISFTFISISYGGALSGSWSPSVAPLGGYAVFIVSTPGGLDVDGDTIQMYQNGILIEQISYGTKGMVPDPLQDESVQRYWNGMKYEEIWGRNWISGPNFGSQNDIPKANLTSIIVLNEVLFYPTVVADYFVEVYNKDILYTMDISGYKIVGDSEYIVPPGTILDVDQDFFYFLYTMDPGFFDPQMDSTGDNVYLYDANGSLLDMVGWNTPHNQGNSVCRIPDGNGTSDGYDDASSVAAKWQFDCAPTVELIKIDLREVAKPIIYGEFGGCATVNLTVSNIQAIDDIINILNFTEEGWSVSIYDENMIIKITDISISAGGFGNFSVNVTLPDSNPFSVPENVTISIRSSNSAIIGDLIILNVRIYPFITLGKSANPTEFYVNGSGHDEVTSITLTATGTGHGFEGIISNNADIIFVVDDTGSMGGILQPLRTEIVNITNIFQDEIQSVRFGLISYKDWPEWDQDLTFNSVDFINAVWSLTPAGGGDVPEDIYGALDWAINAPWRPGNITKIIILIGDAQDHDPYSPCPLVLSAHVDEWGIYTNAIACRISPPFMPETFIAIAENGSGVYAFYDQNMNSGVLAQAIIDAVLTVVPGLDVAAKDIDINDNNPMIRHVLPDYIDYIEGSATTPPDAVYTDSDGNTVLEWNVAKIKIGEIWEVRFQVTSSILGPQLTNVVSESRGNYTNWNDENITMIFPEVLVNVLGVPSPPEPVISVVPGTGHIQLEWEHPHEHNISHYLIYRAEDDPMAFDFSTPWVNTLTDSDPLGLDIIGPRTSWNFTNDVTIAKEIYYCVKTVNDIGWISTSSYSVGKWTRTFPQGLSSFSLPFEPTGIPTADFFLSDMNARYIRWMNPTTNKWMKHGDGEINDAVLLQGEGYEVFFDSATTYSFCGMPAAMILHKDAAFTGFDADTDAKSLTVTVEANGDVNLVWQEPTSMVLWDLYEVFFSDTRDGFFRTRNVDYFLVSAPGFGTNTATHVGAGAHNPGSRLYYMVIPMNQTGFSGTSTYSIGIWTEEFLDMYDTFGIPLKLDFSEGVDWFCDNIPDTVGINFIDDGQGWWSWHSTRMEKGAYDPLLERGIGYQISTSGATKFTFVGI